MTFEFKHPSYYAKLKKDFREEAEKEKKELEESYKVLELPYKSRSERKGRL